MTAIDLNLQTRDRELTEIARSIASLAELFKDLSVLVIDQGTLLDSVEYNIEQTAAHMEDAVRELDVATKYVFPLASPSSPSSSHEAFAPWNCATAVPLLALPIHQTYPSYPPQPGSRRSPAF